MPAPDNVLIVTRSFMDAGQSLLDGFASDGECASVQKAVSE